MITSRTPTSIFCSAILLLLHTKAQVQAGSQFTSHVTINTPTRSFTHGVGNPLPAFDRRSFRQPQFTAYEHPKPSSRVAGYPYERPSIPFDKEDIVPMSRSISAWNSDSFREMSIPILPPSPYHVDSPDPESLWPEGLFLPPVYPPHFHGATHRRGDTGPEITDPFLLEGFEAVAAVEKAHVHGLLYFHDVPHIESLMANQKLRVENQLKPLRIASIRHTWPYNRP